MPTTRQRVAMIAMQTGEQWSTGKIDRIVQQIDQGDRTATSVYQDAMTRLGRPVDRSFLGRIEDNPPGDVVTRRTAGVTTPGTNTPAAPTGPSPDEVARRSREAAQAATLLAEYGLEDLVAIVDQWIRGGLSIDEAMLQLRDPKTDAGKIFDERFPAIQLRRAAGLAPIAPAEYVAYERQATQILRAAGLPAGFYDSRDDFTNLLTADVSIGELNQRVQDGFVAVSRAPAEVRAAFGEFFGADGDAALAAFFLDQDRAVPVLQEIVETAKVGGAAKQFGFGIDKGRANQIRQTGVGFDRARQGFGALADLGSVFNETISEREDLTAEGVGVDAIFGLDQGQAKKKVEGRVEGRVAAFSGAGGAAAGERGGYGLGAARR